MKIDFEADHEQPVCPARHECPNMCPHCHDQEVDLLCAKIGQLKHQLQEADLVIATLSTKIANLQKVVLQHASEQNKDALRRLGE